MSYVLVSCCVVRTVAGSVRRTVRRMTWLGS